MSCCAALAAEKGRPGVQIAESVDALLFSLVLLVLALGTRQPVPPRERRTRRLPEWMRVKSLTGLKLLLWEAILATLVVTAARGSSPPSRIWSGGT